MRPVQMTTTDVHQRMDGSGLHQPSDVLKSLIFRPCQFSSQWGGGVPKIGLPRYIAGWFRDNPNLKWMTSGVPHDWGNPKWNFKRNPRSSKGIPVARTLIFACIRSFRRGETKLKSLNCNSAESANQEFPSSWIVINHQSASICIKYLVDDGGFLLTV